MGERRVREHLQFWLQGRDTRATFLKASVLCEPRISAARRWSALGSLVGLRPDLPAWVLRKLASIIERGPCARRSLRRAAAIAFLQLAADADLGDSFRMQ